MVNSVDGARNGRSAGRKNLYTARRRGGAASRIYVASSSNSPRRPDREDDNHVERLSGGGGEKHHRVQDAARTKAPPFWPVKFFLEII